MGRLSSGRHTTSGVTVTLWRWLCDLNEELLETLSIVPFEVVNLFDLISVSLAVKSVSLTDIIIRDMMRSIILMFSGFVISVTTRFILITRLERLTRVRC